MAGVFIGSAIVVFSIIVLLLSYSRISTWARRITDSSWDYVSDRFGAAGDWVLGIALSAIAVNQFLPAIENLAQPYIWPLLVITMVLWALGWYVKP